MATGTLTGQTIANTYKALLKITGTTAGGETLHATTLKVIEDGDGNPTPIQLAQNRIEIVPTANHANAFEVSQADGTQIFNINSTTPGFTINAATVTLTQDTDFVTSGGVNGMSIDGTTFSVDGTNNRIGIGTASPGKILDIAQAQNADSSIRFINSNTSTASSTTLNLGNGTDGSYLTLHGTGWTTSGVFRRSGTILNHYNGAGGLTLNTQVAAPIYFATNGTDRMTIDSSGNVGIGTGTIANESDHYKLKISGASGTGAGIIEFADGSDNIDGAIFSDGGNLFIIADRDNTTADSSIRFRVDGSTERMRILSSGGITFNGDTAAANALDDYEEGEYDGAITCASGTITVSSSHNRLSYTKIGDVVLVTGTLTISAISSPSGATTLNLPFTSKNLTDLAGSATQPGLVFLNGTAITDGSFLTTMTIAENSATCRIFFIDAGTSTTENIGDNHIAVNSDIHVNLTYKAA